MCLSTVYVQVRERQQKVMQDVAKMEFRGDGYLLVGLLGDQKTIVGRITQIDFVDDHSVIFETETEVKKAKPMRSALNENFKHRIVNQFRDQY